MAHTPAIPRACLLVLMAGLAMLQPCKADSPSRDDGEVKEEKSVPSIVGSWQLVKAAGLKLPEGFVATAKFDKEGKLTVTTSFMGHVQTKSGTYKLNGKRLTVKAEKEKDEVQTIKTLDERKLVAVDARGQEAEFTRVK